MDPLSTVASGRARHQFRRTRPVVPRGWIRPGISNRGGTVESGQPVPKPSFVRSYLPPQVIAPTLGMRFNGGVANLVRKPARSTVALDCDGHLDASRSPSAWVEHVTAPRCSRTPRTPEHQCDPIRHLVWTDPGSPRVWDSRTPDSAGIARESASVTFGCSRSRPASDQPELSR
jgi:hypothetical protein